MVEHGEVEGRSSGRSAWTGRVACEPGYTRLGPGHLKCRDGERERLICQQIYLYPFRTMEWGHSRLFGDGGLRG